MQELTTIHNLLSLGTTVIDLIDYAQRKSDIYDSERRYDDNAAKLLEQSLRLYERGEITKEALHTIIDCLPNTVKH